MGDPDLSFLYPIVNASGKNLCEDYIEDWRRFIQQGPYTYYDEWLGLLGGDGKKASIFAREGEPLQRMMGYQTSGRGYRILIIWLPERMQEALGNKSSSSSKSPPSAPSSSWSRWTSVRPSDAAQSYADPSPSPPH